MLDTENSEPIETPATRSLTPLPYDELARDLTVSHIMTAFEDLAVVNVDDSPKHVVSVLASRQLDYAPVVDSGTFVGRVALAKAKCATAATVGHITEPLSARYLLSASSPIGDVIRWLNDEPWQLVVEGRSIAGLVTRADLNRQAVRVYFYMLIADFEVRVATRLRKRFDCQRELLPLLSERAAREVLNRYNDLSEMGVDVDLVAAMNLAHLCRAFGKTPELRGLVYESDNPWNRAVGGIIGFRNQVMHPTRTLLSSEADHERLIDMDLRLRRLLRRLPPEHPQPPDD